MKNTIFAIIVLLMFFLNPYSVTAEEKVVSTADDIENAIESAHDGDIIKIKGYEAKNSIIDFENLKSLEIDKDLIFEGSLNSKTNWEPAYLSNIKIEIKSGKTLTLKNIKLKGKENADVIIGDGNLTIEDGNNIEAQPGKSAININGKVTIQNIGDKRRNSFIGYSNNINGGDATGENSAGTAIIAGEFIMNDPENKEFAINGGNSVKGKGGYAIYANNINIDISNTYTGDIHIASSSIKINGGNGKYPGGAIKGKDITLVAGIEMIKPGTGIVKDHDIKFNVEDPNYTATVEVKKGGSLTFGAGIDNQKKSTLSGFRHSYYYGPTILAKGNANVTILGGLLFGASNQNKDQRYIPQAPVIHMGTGKLKVINEEKETNLLSKKEINITSGNSGYFNAPKGTILTDGSVYLSGNVQVTGAKFTETFSGNNPLTEYKGSIVGSAGIITTADVTLENGAHVMGGSIDNIDTTKNFNYQYGPGIVGNGSNSVTINREATVQGYGLVNYSKIAQKELRYTETKSNPIDISGGNGLENIGTVIIDYGHVHGGDVSPKFGNGEYGKGGVAIKNCKIIKISGDSLITGGSSIKSRSGSEMMDFNGSNHAGPAIDNSGVKDTSLTLSGDAKVFGGTSSSKAGSAIVGVADINILEFPGKDCHVKVYGGASNKEAGKGIENSKNVTIAGGEVKAGNVFFPKLLEDYYNHPQGKSYKISLIKSVGNNNNPGNSVDSVAIKASGKVIIDGDKDHMPLIQSFFENAPIVKLTDKDSALYVGKAEFKAKTAESNLVQGGKYHVDIFKDNYVNTGKAILPDAGYKYKADSIALYRILEKDENSYKDVDKESLRKSPAYDNVFFDDKGIHLYKEDQALNKTIKQESIIRKDVNQKTVKEIEEKNKIDKMASDNITAKIVDEVTLTYKSTNHTTGKVPAPQVVSVGSEVSVQEQGTLKREGYNFEGWMDKSTGKIYQAGDKITLEKDMILEAIWVKVEYEHNAIKVSTLLDEPQSPKKDIKIYDIHKAYIKGYPDGTVRPDGNITRAETAAMLSRILELNMSNNSAPNFTDTKDVNAWYNAAINAIVNRGLMKGYPDGSFKPNSPISRAEFAQTIKTIDKANSAIAPFEDVEGHWAKEAIGQAYGNGRIVGYTDGSFRPDQYITRCEVAKVINSLFDRMVRAQGLLSIEKGEIVRFTDLDVSYWGYYEIVEATNTHTYERVSEGEVEELWHEVLVPEFNR